MKKLISFLTCLMVLGMAPSKAYSETFDDQKICKAAISAIMGRPVAIMKSKLVKDEVVLSYVRQMDGQRFDYKCVIPPSTGRVIWAAKIEGKWGRWRDHPQDPVITYSIEQNKLLVTESWGNKPDEKSTKEFTQNDFIGKKR